MPTSGTSMKMAPGLGNVIQQKFTAVAPPKAPINVPGIGPMVPMKYVPNVAAPPNGAAAAILHAKAALDPNSSANLAIKFQDPNYTPSMVDLIIAGNLGLDTSRWAGGAGASADIGDAAAAGAAANIAAGAYNPGETLDQYGNSYGSSLAAHGNTGHVASQAEVRAFFVLMYAQLAQQLGIQTVDPGTGEPIF